MRTILLVDCNNFFASCEELFNPALKGLPLCVLSNNDGCVVARSNAAKDMGIPMGIPYFMAKKKFKNGVFVSGDLSKYSEISKRIMTKLEDFTPSIEKYSIDEAFLDITGTEKFHKMNGMQIGDKIRKTIKEEIGIEVSIGISNTKTLAKIASEIAKNNTRRHIKTEFEGVFEINETNRKEILKNTSIEEVWGIGKNLHKFFRKHNIQNALILSEIDKDFIERNLGKKGVYIKEELNGISAYKLEDTYTPPKSISKSSSFKEFSKDRAFIKNELNNHLHRVCIKLRKHDLSASVMSVMLRYKDFRVCTEKTVFHTPKNSEFELYKEMHRLFDILYREDIIYRSAGVCVNRLTKTKDVQLMLFESEEAKKKKRLSDTWDKIEQKFGYGAINIGCRKKD